MKRFTQSIRDAVKQENWFSAIFIGLAMPDVCGSLETPDEKVGVRYKRWFNDNLKFKYDIENNYELQRFHDPKMIAIKESNPLYDENIKELKTQLIPRERRFTSDDCYAFRNACLHSGMAAAQKNAIKLTPPLEGKGVVHKCIVNGALQLQINVFCEDICLAVDEWAEKNKGNKEIQERIAELIEVSHIMVNGHRVFG